MPGNHDKTEAPVEITPEDLDRSSRPGGRRILPPPNYGSRAMRLKLYVLVGSLLLVFVLMEQVRNPDLWRRIGFTDKPAGTKSDEPIWTEVRIAPDDEELQQEPEADSGKKIAPPTVDEQNADVGGDDQSVVIDAGKESADLWTGLFRGLKPDELNTVAARMVAGIESPAGTEIGAVAKTLDQRLGNEVTLRLEQIAILGQSDRPRAAVMAQGVARAQIEWRGKLRAWLESDTALEGDNSEFVSFERAMQSVAMEKIEDRTGPARKVEGAAWLLALHQCMKADRSDVPTEPAIYEMMTMPSRYRATRVRLKGQLLGIEPLRTSGNAMGIEQYWILWIGEESGGNVPACVYLTNKPDNFPGDETGFAKCKLPVQVDGLFFKLRTYTASDRTSAVCPLILSSNVQLIQVADVASGTAAGTGQLPAGWPWMVAGLIAVAIFVAWNAWRSIRSGLRHPEPAGLREGLKVLADNDGILTHREQVARLQERMKS